VTPVVAVLSHEAAAAAVVAAAWHYAVSQFKNAPTVVVSTNGDYF